MKNSGFVIGAFVVVVAGFSVAYFLQQPDAAVPPSPAPTSAAAPEVTVAKADLHEIFVRSHSQRVGNPMAKVTVVEWFDPECEACRAMHPIFKKIIEDYQDRVFFVFRYMPYHKGSMFAATALEEAAEVGKFLEALNILYDKQPEWGSHHAPKPELIPTYLTGLGIPPEKLQQAYLLAKHGDKIQTDKADGEKVGVSGTPSFFVNQMAVGLGDEPLREAIDMALAAALN